MYSCYKVHRNILCLIFRCVSISISLKFTDLLTNSLTHSLTNRHLALFKIRQVITGQDR